MGKKRIAVLVRDRQSEALRMSLIEAHSKDHEVTVIDLPKRDIPYERIVEEICAHDKVISW